MAFSHCVKDHFAASIFADSKSRNSRYVLLLFFSSIFSLLKEEIAEGGSNARSSQAKRYHHTKVKLVFASRPLVIQTSSRSRDIETNGIPLNTIPPVTVAERK